VLDVRLAHGVDEERRDDEPLQDDGHGREEVAPQPQVRVNEHRKGPQQDPLEGDRVDDAADPAHPQGDEVERQGHDQQRVEELEDHRATSPVG
jgi:hypothetical protein